MFEVTVEAGFSSGHYLRNYRGKCENPHGHNYKVFITLQGKDLDEAGLLLDFKLLKQVMRPVVDYLDHQFLPIRIIITNSGDRPISLNDARINFISAHGDRIPAAEPIDVERRISLRDKTGSNIPVGPIHIHTKPKNPNGKVEQDFSEFEYAAIVVEPHTTRAGFLFYDIQGLGSAPLHGAKLVFRQVKNADGKELFYFEIPFDKYLQTQPQ